MSVHVGILSTLEMCAITNFLYACLFTFLKAYLCLVNFQ